MQIINKSNAVEKNSLTCCTPSCEVGSHSSLTAFRHKRSGDDFNRIIVASVPRFSVNVFKLRSRNFSVIDLSVRPRADVGDVKTFHCKTFVSVIVCHISSIVYRCDTSGPKSGINPKKRGIHA